MATFVSDLINTSITVADCVDSVIESSRALGEYIKDKYEWFKITICNMAPRTKNKLCGAILTSTKEDTINNLLKPILSSEFPEENKSLIDFQSLYTRIKNYVQHTVFTLLHTLFVRR